MRRILDALGRLGGALVSPRRTLIGVVERGDGSLFEVLVLALFCAVIVAPTAAGHAILILRVSPLDGLMALSTAVVGRFANAFVLALIGAAVVFAASRLRLAFDKVLDACAYALVPHFALAAVGAGLAELGLEAWALPHRNLRGEGPYYLARLAAGYGWSVALLGLLAVHAARRRDDP